uniref:Mas1 n=1 Tax=Arundo donax TaxID=35708 RepID=A0A0A9BB53_ARUDO
MATHRDGAPR